MIRKYDAQMNHLLLKVNIHKNKEIEELFIKNIKNIKNILNIYILKSNKRCHIDCSQTISKSRN